MHPHYRLRFAQMDLTSIWGNDTLDAANFTNYNGNDSFGADERVPVFGDPDYEVHFKSSIPVDPPMVVLYEFEAFGDSYIATVPDIVTYLQIYGFVTAPVNIFGAVVILRGSTAAMSGYKWHLLNFQIWSATFEFVMCSLLTNLPEFTDVLDFTWARFYGLLVSQFSASLFVCAIFMVVPVVFLFLSIAQCFAYRHQMLLEAGSKLQPKTFNLVLLVIHVLAIFGISIVLHMSYRVYIDEIVTVRRYDMDENWDNYYEMNPNIISKVVLIPAMSVMVGGMLLIITLTISCAHILISTGGNLSAKTKARQWAFIRVLCVQTGMPILVIVLPLMYRLLRGATPPLPDEEIRGAGGMELQTLILWAAIHCHGIISTFTLLFLKPYRDYVKKVFALDKLSSSIHVKSAEAIATKSASLVDSSTAA